MRRALRHAALLLALCATTAAPAHADYRYTPEDVLAAMSTHSALAACIVTGEVGGVGFDPYAVGGQGELGPVQLLPVYGKLPEFYEQGFDNPFSPYQAMDYLDAALARGEGPAWTTYRRCV
jgi:hypothetical protein